MPTRNSEIWHDFFQGGCCWVEQSFTCRVSHNSRLWPAVPHWHGDNKTYPHISKCLLGKYCFLVWRGNFSLDKRTAYIYITRPRWCQVLNPSLQKASVAKGELTENIIVIDSSSSLTLTLAALGNSFIKYFPSWGLVISTTHNSLVHLFISSSTSILDDIPQPYWIWAPLLEDKVGVSTNPGPPLEQPYVTIPRLLGVHTWSFPHLSCPLSRGTFLLVSFCPAHKGVCLSLQSESFTSLLQIRRNGISLSSPFLPFFSLCLPYHVSGIGLNRRRTRENPQSLFYQVELASVVSTNAGIVQV